ncbi:MAG: hypothetical protein QM805_09450 [Pseudomonas sp.]
MAFTQNELIGFKDAQGSVKVPPKLSPVFTLAPAFRAHHRHR